MAFLAVDCFAKGTRIQTDKGECAVENLQEGQRVLTSKGEYKKIQWIGRKAVRLKADDPAPILIRKDAFADNLPHRDLVVSEKHGIALGDCLVMAAWLVNGVSVSRLRGLEEIEYFHVDCGSHEIIYAEGAMAETYVDQGGRQSFDNGAEFQQRHPHAKPVRAIMMYVRPLAATSAELQDLRKAIALRAQALGLPRVA